MIVYLFLLVKNQVGISIEKKKSIDLCYFFTGKFKDLGVINFSTVSSVTFLRAS